MRSFDEIKHLPQFPGIYGFKWPNDIQNNYSYIGLSNKLREKVSQHLLKRESSVATVATAISLNPDKIAECHWWIHESFGAREYLEAAELIAFERFNPTLVSRGSPSTKALDISNNEDFKKQMEKLFSNFPSGYIKFYDLSWAVNKIKQLENEILELKKVISDKEK